MTLTFYDALKSTIQDNWKNSQIHVCNVAMFHVFVYSFFKCLTLWVWLGDYRQKVASAWSTKTWEPNYNHLLLLWRKKFLKSKSWVYKYYTIYKYLINPWHFLKQARFPVPEPITYFLHNYGQKYIIIFPWNQFYENFREINFTENINWPEHQQGVHPKGFDSCKPKVPWWQRSQPMPSTFTLQSHCPWLHSENWKKGIFITENNCII